MDFSAKGASYNKRADYKVEPPNLFVRRPEKGMGVLPPCPIIDFI